MWKDALIKPIPKANEDPTSVSSYRPISLLDCAGKLCEKLVHKWLSNFVDHNGILKDSQCGFRRNHSVYDIREGIEVTFIQKLITRSLQVVILQQSFLISRRRLIAVWIKSVLMKLCKFGVR